MPYYITSESAECSGWATIKEDGEVLGCHTTKAAAIAQMIAVSLAEEVEPGGERNIDEARAVNLDPPEYMRAAARRGLEFYGEGLAGDGLVDRTVREARLMADGQVSEDKWVRIAAWIARHMPDLDAPAANPDHENYPSPGVVAHLLWGSPATKEGAQRAMEYAQGVVERIKAEDDQKRWASVSINLNKDEGEEVTKTSVERRLHHVDFELRDAEATGSGMTFRGYAAVFDSPSQPLPFTEVIKPGAFTRSLKSRNEIKLFKNHNTDIVLGSTRSGTLRLTEDSKGLLAEAELPDTTDGRDLAVLMKRGDVNSMSFGFSVPPKGDSWINGGSERILNQVRLHEVSIVTGFPAYQATTATVRSLDFLATRTAVDADLLASALEALEQGGELSDDQAGLINEVVAKLRTNPEPESDAPPVPNLLELKRKQLDLMAKA